MLATGECQETVPDLVRVTDTNQVACFHPQADAVR